MNDLKKHILSNGIPVYFYIDKELKRTYASYNVKYGSLGYYDKFIYKGKHYNMPPGMAHFLEHTLIEESKRGNMLMRFKDKNYLTNGGTYPELTSYYFIGIKDVKRSIRELIEMVDEPAFTPESIENVKSAIISELNKREDARYSVAYQLNRRNSFKAFETCPECLNILGTPESTKGITYEEAKISYDAYYRTCNKFLVIGGNFDEKKMLEYLEKIYAHIPFHEDEFKEDSYDDLLPIRKEYEEIYKPVTIDHAIITYKMRNDFDLPLLKLDAYLYIFYRAHLSTSTELVANLIKQDKIVGGISQSVDFFKDVISVTISADIKTDIEDFQKAIATALQDKSVSQNLFDLIIKSLKANNLSRMDYIYESLVEFPSTIDFSEKLFHIDVLSSLSLEEYTRVMSSLDFSIKTVTLLSNKKTN